jgi:hypothetical protein
MREEYVEIWRSGRNGFEGCRFEGRFFRLGNRRALALDPATQRWDLRLVGGRGDANILAPHSMIFSPCASSGWMVELGGWG